MNRRSLSVIQILAIFLIIPSLTFGQQFPTSERVVGPTETDLVLTVRLSPNVKAETLALLNQSTVPRIVRLEKNKNLKVLLSSIYGAFLPRIKSEVRALNPWLPANDYNDLLLNATSELKLPAGGEYYTNVIKAATRETNFPQQARLETGTDTKEIVSRIHQTTNSFKNFFKNFCRTRECTVPQKAALATQRSIAFPFVSRYVSFTLKPEVASQAGVLLEKLKTDSAVIDAEIHSPSKLISHVNDSSLAAAGPGCGSEPLERDWFIHSLSLDKLPIDVLRGNNATTIAIMDSGIVHNDKRFELWQNIPEANGLEGTDDDVNGYVDDTVGCNFIMQSDFPFDDQFGLDYRNHGTHVTGLASGRFLAEPLATAITQRVRPMVLKIADSSGFVDNGGVNDAIVYAQNKNASIINMSFEGSFSASIKRYIKEDLGRLYVVAAGNGDLQGQGLNVDHSHVQLFPAKLARELPNVISVAAHGENGTLACFSNFGEHTVDLAAPGVAIESTIADGQLAKLTGTSQAAPLVSLAAALLHSQGLSEPALIKQRILSSVDYVPGYRGKLASEGKLNIAKAVSIFDDVIELNDQQRSLFRGRIVSPPATLIIGEKTIPFKVIKKIVNFPLPDGSFVNRVTWFNLGKLEHVYGQLTIPNLILKVGDTCIELPMESIRDVIPAWKTPTQAPVCVTS